MTELFSKTPTLSWFNLLTTLIRAELQAGKCGNSSFYLKVN